MRAPITVCADDYGLTPGVSRGILEVAEAGRVSAVSAMTASRCWSDWSSSLRPLAGHVDVGLHLTLTDLEPAGAMPRTAPRGTLPTLGRLLVAAFVGRLHAGEIEAEIDRQLEHFVQGIGRLPDFVDGHQHAHLLPGVRRILIQRLACLPPPRPYLRDCREPGAAIVRRQVAVAKTLVVSGLAGGMAAEARAAGLETNDSFRGVLDYEGGAELPAVMRRFLAGPGARPLVMCHPGIPDAALAGRDPLVEPRLRERDYLLGPAFVADLEAADRRLARLAPS